MSRKGVGTSEIPMIGGDALGKPNPGVNIPGFNVGAKAPKARKGKRGKKTMKLASGATSSVSTPRRG